jgi:hypothetical protein
MFIFGLHGQCFQFSQQQNSSGKQDASAAACVNMPQVIIKPYADNKICIVYTAKTAHLCMEDGANFLCTCSVLDHLPWQIALV